jgi:hypothetical protein
MTITPAFNSRANILTQLQHRVEPLDVLVQSQELRCAAREAWMKANSRKRDKGGLSSARDGRLDAKAERRGVLTGQFWERHRLVDRHRLVVAARQGPELRRYRALRRPRRRRAMAVQDAIELHLHLFEEGRVACVGVHECLLRVSAHMYAWPDLGRGGGSRSGHGELDVGQAKAGQAQLGRGALEHLQRRRPQARLGRRAGARRARIGRVQEESRVARSRERGESAAVRRRERDGPGGADGAAPSHTLCERAGRDRNRRSGERVLGDGRTRFRHVDVGEVRLEARDTPGNFRADLGEAAVLGERRELGGLLADLGMCADVVHLLSNGGAEVHGVLEPLDVRRLPAVREALVHPPRAENVEGNDGVLCAVAYSEF